MSTNTERYKDLVKNSKPKERVVKKSEDKVKEAVGKAIWDELSKQFDWLRVHSVMVALNWRWAHATTESMVPCTADMKRVCRKLLKDVMGDTRVQVLQGRDYTNISSSTGGFVMERHVKKGKKDTYHLLFRVAEAEFAEEDYECIKQDEGVRSVSV